MTDKKSDISRRAVLRGLIQVVGTGVFCSATQNTMIEAAIAYSREAQAPISDGKIFNSQQLTMLKQICAVVIPETETAGAHQVDTHGFIDHQLALCFTEKVQNAHINLLDFIDKHSIQKYGNGFVELAEDVQIHIISKIDSDPDYADKKRRKAFKELKSLIAFGYFTSKVGMTQELRYQPIPGGYDGDYPYSAGDGAWAS